MIATPIFLARGSTIPAASLPIYQVYESYNGAVPCRAVHQAGCQNLLKLRAIFPQTRP